MVRTGRNTIHQIKVGLIHRSGHVVLSLDLIKTEFCLRQDSLLAWCGGGEGEREGVGGSKIPKAGNGVGREGHGEEGHYT